MEEESFRRCHGSVSSMRCWFPGAVPGAATARPEPGRGGPQRILYSIMAHARPRSPFRGISLLSSVGGCQTEADPPHQSPSGSRHARPARGRPHNRPHPPLSRKASHDLAPTFHRHRSLARRRRAGPRPGTPAARRSQGSAGEALGYTPDATKVDKAKYPKYAAGPGLQRLRAVPGQGRRRGRPVPAVRRQGGRGEGWCSAWVKKA